MSQEAAARTKTTAARAPQAKAATESKSAEAASENTGTHLHAVSDSALLSKRDLEVLKGPFSHDRLGVKVQSLNKDRTRAMLVLYLQHTDVQDRLEEVDPAWTCESVSETREGDTVYVRSRMTVKGVTRENVGDGGDPKSAYSDALKRCAMLFGVGRYLYDTITVWTEYNEARDKFRTWTVEDYEAALQRVRQPGLARKVPEPAPAATAPREEASAPAAPSAAAPSATAPKVAPKGAAKSASRPREELNRVLMNLYRPYLTQFPQTQFAQLLQTRYQVGETRLMTVEQLEDLVQFMEQKLHSVA